MNILNLQFRVNMLTQSVSYGTIDVMITIILKFLEKVLKSKMETESGREQREGIEVPKIVFPKFIVYELKLWKVEGRRGEKSKVRLALTHSPSYMQVETVGRMLLRRKGTI